MKGDAMVIEADTAEELRMHILILVTRKEAALRGAVSYCRSISERRAFHAAIGACEELRGDVEALVIKPKNGAAA